MSAADVEVIRRIFDIWASDGVEMILPFIHLEFEVTTPPDLAAEPDTYRGHDGIRRYFDSFYEQMDRISLEPQEFIDTEAAVVVPMVIRARGRTSQLEATQAAVGVWRLREGKVHRLEVFADRDDALAAGRAD